ncbi:insulinase family protein [bacterium]|nr:insulinase family protein [bacterium]MBU1638348.1 insulinase family protein [bacterium]MBU1919682.1 insulinase family protein [bacterium]
MTKQSPYHKTTLPGGLRIVSEKVPGVRSAALGIWVTVGSRHETATDNGISHFIEHMAFKGTTARSALDIAKTIERGGGYINAFTGKELTCFYVHVLDEQLPVAFDILSDILRNSVHDPLEIEKEKLVILDEIRDHEDMPDDLIHEYFVREVFPAHPLARPILGPPENVKSFTRDILKGFIREHYSNKRMLVVAAGNVNHGKLVKMVERGLEVPSKSKAPVLEKALPLRRTTKRYQKAIQQAHMVIGARSVPYSSKDRLAIAMLNTVLGGGMSSRLFQNIREKHGLAYAIYSFSEALTDTGYWGVYLATDPARLSKAQKLVRKEFEALKERPIDKTELEEVKTQFKGSLALGLENVSSRMMRLARMEIYLKRYVPLDEISELIDSVTPARLQKLANQLFDSESLVAAILEPESKKTAKPAQQIA